MEERRGGSLLLFSDLGIGFEILPGCTSSGPGTGTACANVRTATTSAKPMRANIFCGVVFAGKVYLKYGDKSPCIPGIRS